MGRKERQRRYPGPTFSIAGKNRAKLGYFWDHAFFKAKSGPHLGGVGNPDSGFAMLDSEQQKLTSLGFIYKLKVSEVLPSLHGGTTRFSPLWQADRSRIQRMAPLEYIGCSMAGWFDFAIADGLHQLAGDTAQGNGLGVFGRAAKKLIALTGTLMGGYADDLFNIFYCMEPRTMVAEGLTYGGQDGATSSSSMVCWKRSRRCRRRTTPAFAPRRPFTSHGQEDARGTHDGGQVLGRGSPGARR